MLAGYRIKNADKSHLLVLIGRGGSPGTNSTHGLRSHRAPFGISSDVSGDLLGDVGTVGKGLDRFGGGIGLIRMPLDDLDLLLERYDAGSCDSGPSRLGSRACCNENVIRFLGVEADGQKREQSESKTIEHRP